MEEAKNLFSPFDLLADFSTLQINWAETDFVKFRFLL